MASGYQPSHEAVIPSQSRKIIRHRTNEYIYTTNANTGNNNVAQDRMAFSESLGIIITRPKFQRYKLISTREATFTNWTKPQDVQLMARAGFVFTGQEDITGCYYCGINLKDWPPLACPWEQHAIASPKCGHLLQCKGESFIRSCIEGRGRVPDIDACDVIDLVQLAINRNEEAVKLAKEYITEEDLLKRSIKWLIEDNPSGKFTATQIVQISQELEVQDESSESQDDTDTDIEHEETESDDDIDLEETNRQLKDPVVCKVCYDAIACMVTLPCGHMVCCSQCISAMTTCAVCRSEIKGTVRAVMAV